MPFCAQLCPFVPLCALQGKRHLYKQQLAPLFNHIKLIIMNICSRAKAPTPRFFRIIRNIGLLLTAVGSALVATPVWLPVIVVKAAGYMILGGSIASAISQLTTDAGPIENTEVKKISAPNSGDNF